MSIIFLLFVHGVFSMSTNFSIVMSVGDSITAGLGARWSYLRPTFFVYEDCGVSFGTGGDEDTISLARLIENKWGIEIVGKSFGSRRVNLCIDKPSNSTTIPIHFTFNFTSSGVFCPRDPTKLHRKEDGFNVAMTGATSEALLLQWMELKRRFVKEAYFMKGPILLTLMIGVNDLCMWDCSRPEAQLRAFKYNLNAFIQKVGEYFGDRVSVLIGEIPNLDGVPERAGGSIMESFARLECPCAYSGSGYDFKKRIGEYNEIINDLRFGRDENDHRIVITSVLRREQLKDWPREFTSKLDAFHPSQQAQSYFAQEIFNELEEK